MKKVISFFSIVTMIFMLVMGTNINSLAATGTNTTNLKIAVTYRQTDARSMLSMINAFRTGNDAWYWNSSNTKKVSCKTHTLTYDYNLEKIAMQRASEIALSFSHTRPNGKSCFSIKVNNCSSWGENIAAGYTNAKSVFKGWQETNEKYDGQGHRRNMLDSDFNAIGIAHVSYNGMEYWVQEFGLTNSNPTKVSANNKTSTVSIDVLSSRIKEYKITPSVSSLKLKCNQQVTLPTINTYAVIQGAWPSSNCKIKANYTWKVANTSYAKISGNKLVGKKAGKTSLTATVLGKKVSIPVTITSSTPTKPGKVNGLKASSQTTTSIKLGWSKVSGATGYKVYQYNTRKKKYVKIGTTKNNTYTIKKLKAGTNYSFKVIAYKVVNKKEYTGSYSNVLKTATKTATPKISRLTTKRKKATVQWKKVSGATGYEVYMATSKRGKYTRVSTIRKASTVRYTKSKLRRKKRYYFKVRAYKTVNGKKIYSSYSTAKSIKVK